MKTFQTVKRWFQELERERSIEASKLTFAVIGVGTVLGDLASTKLDLLAVSVAVIAAAWLGIYRLFA